jgi:hypothetical protein
LVWVSGGEANFEDAKIILALTARMFDFEPSITYFRVLKGAVRLAIVRYS